MTGTFLTGKFRWGVCIDDPWIYAGVRPPKSIVIPHLIDLYLPQGPFSMDFGENESRSEKRAFDRDPDLSTVALFDLSENQRSAFTRLFSKNLARGLARNKIQFVRCWFQWNLFERSVLPREDQAFSFPLDNFVKSLREFGIGIIAVIGNGYSRFLPHGLDADKLETYLAYLGRASREIIRRYRGKISAWQLENEPNWWREHYASGWRRGPIWLDESLPNIVLNELYSIAKQEDPSTPTVINLEADTAVSALSKPYLKYCDMVGLDFYPNYASATPIDVEIFGKATQVAKMIGKKVMVSETGYPSGPSLLGYSKNHQAEYVSAACKKAFSIDAISSLAMWRLSDPYWLSFPYQENSFGLIDRQGFPKPAWTEYAVQCKNMS